MEKENTIWYIDLVDWLFLKSDNVLINRTSMTKFGLHVGEVIIVFRREGELEVGFVNVLYNNAIHNAINISSRAWVCYYFRNESISLTERLLRGAEKNLMVK